MKIEEFVAILNEARDNLQRSEIAVLLYLSTLVCKHYKQGIIYDPRAGKFRATDH